MGSLCLSLRKRFGDLSNEKQRIPHCELFKNGKNKKCHVCKQSGHKRKECPRKNKKTMNGWSTPKDAENESGDKLRNRLERIIERTQALKMKKERELALLSEKESELMRLLNECKANKVDDKALRLGIKQIAKSFNGQRKEMKKMDKMRRKKEKKDRKKEKKMKRRMRKKMKREKRKNEKGDVEDEDENEFVKVGDSEDGSSTNYSEGDEDTCSPGNEDEFDLIFEGF